MKMLRTLLVAQFVCVLLLLAIVLSALVTTEQQHVKESYDRQKIALTQLLKNFVGEDYKTLVQQIRASTNPQMLQLSKLDGTVLHEHNNASSGSALLEQIFSLTGIEQKAAVIKNDEHQLQLQFIPDFDRSNAVFLQAFWMTLLAPLFLCLLPAILTPLLLKAQLRKVSHNISHAIERFMRDPAAELQTQDLTDEFEDVALSLNKFSEFSQQQFNEMSQTARQVTEDAFRDSITGLPNRNRFVQFYEEHLREGSEKDFGIFAITRCTELQNINQSRGFQEGDKYILSVSELIQKVAASYRDHKVYRLNSSDFAILLPRVTLKDAENFATQLQSRLNEYQKIAELDSVAYTGLVSYETGKPLGEILAVADTSISLAQTKQSNSWHVQKDSAVGEIGIGGYGNQNWRNVIDDVLDNSRISLLLQTVQPSNRSSKTYSEILVRFKTIEDQILPTASFLAMAEKLDKIIAVDRLIIETALTTIKNRNMQDQYFGLNLSPRCVHDDQFVIWLERRLLKDASIASKLVFEVSEYGLQQNLKTSKRFIDMLHRCGCRLTVEKFGVGITSFKFFRDLKPDFVKMDGSYTRHIDEDKNNQYFMRLMIDLAHRIGVGVLAESVESQEEKHMLESLFIDGTQGYYIGKPAPL
ncbi:MAG TPA: diguanylate phosphodiesterase [Rheinheimera sp.]|uniref:EAL domain-containing protein n=1 Tax=Rheinheimera sp. TaxID=1869214 RepID=UPI000ECE269F|nr:GGDEF domain-containing protein [Rheinheimera sp.]HCU66703.1 diguanylate phosphodiesterase [Rheinheimera sp.]